MRRSQVGSDKYISNNITTPHSPRNLHTCSTTTMTTTDMEAKPTVNQKASYLEDAENVMVLYDHYDAGMLYATSKSRMLQKMFV